MLFVGIDGEMSCPDMEKGGKLIQIGLAVMTDVGIESVGYLLQPPADMFWEDRAALVHQIPLQRLVEEGLPAEQVDDLLYQWLVDHGANPRQRAKTVPVGFNITGFDMPFVKATLPKTYSLLSRRTAELNGMLWLLHGKKGHGMETWKQLAMDYAQINLPDYKPHDAEWDAKRHILCFEYLKNSV